MKNVVMQLCRETNGYSEQQVADKLGMTPDEYTELETSAVYMSPERAGQLSALYNIDAEYFLESSRQLELLDARAEVIKHFGAEIERYKKFVNAMLLLTNETMNGTEAKDKHASHGQETVHQ